MQGGFYRVHLEADDGDWMTLFAPLDENGRIDAAKPRPYLFKSQWCGAEYYGELSLVEDPRFVWGADAPDSLTDITSVSLEEWAKVTIWQEDTHDSPKFIFRVRTIDRV